ncbi:MAG: CapA family protein, partial [bacterium]
MKIVALGDVFLGGDLFYKDDDWDILSKGIIDIFEKADLRIANLEGPLISDFSKKNIPMPNKLLQGCPEEMVKWLTKYNINYVSLANNHMFDYGKKGLNNTIKILQDNNIKYSGAGNDMSEARKPAIFNLENKKISIHSYTEYNKPYLKQIVPATENTYGVMPLDLKLMEEDINKFKSDINIVFIHWGREHMYYPHPEEQVKIGKKIIDLGFDVVLGSHAHYPQRLDYYKNKPVVYSMGNFLFPNFYYTSPAQIIYFKEKPLESDMKDTTYDLPGRVNKTIYKKWSKENRQSLLCEINVIDKNIKINKVYCLQNEKEPFIKEMEEDKSIELYNILNKDIN